MGEEVFHYKVIVTFSETELQNESAEVVVKFYAASELEPRESKQVLKALHRELLYALIGAGQAEKATLRTAFWYVKFDKNYYYFTDVVVCQNDDAFEAMLPAAYRLDEAGAATKAYLADLRSIGMSSDGWANRSGRVLQDLTLKNVSGIWTLTAEASLSRHALGEFAGVLPTPGPWNMPKRGLWRDHKNPLANRNHRLVVGAWNGQQVEMRLSESLSKSLGDLTSMLQSPKSHVTLIMGEPGTGKEVFSDAMHFGTCMGWNKAWATRRTEEADTEFETIILDGGKEARSIAGIALEEFNERLFTVVPGSDDQGTTGSAMKCLVHEAQGGGTIFLDEFDKPVRSGEIYSALLRVLEAKEFILRTVHDDRVVTGPAKYKDVSWVMAGAFVQVDPRESIPRDLWSRMTGLLHLKNPVADDPNYGATLFMFAYLTQVATTLIAKGSIETGVAALLAALSKGASSAFTFRESVALRMLGYKPPEPGAEIGLADAPFLPEQGLQLLANDFAKHLRFKTKFVGDATDTPRGIMKAADAAFRVIRDRCIAKPSWYLGIEDGKDLEAANSARDAAHDTLVVSRGPS